MKALVLIPPTGREPAPTASALTSLAWIAMMLGHSDPPDADRVYELYLETCPCLGVELTPRERAQDLIAEWSDAIAAGRTVPSIKH